MSPRSVDSLKRQATRLKKATGCSHSEALDLVARSQGFDNWSLLTKARAPKSSGYVGATLKVETVLEIIGLAERLQIARASINQKQSNLPDEGFAASEIIAAMDDYDRNPDRKALYQRVEKLAKDELMELTALMWLGRGDSGERAVDWKELVCEAYAKSDEGDLVYVCSKTPLSEYLRDGLEKLGLR